MSVLEPQTLKLRDGAAVTLRSPRVDEAQAVIDYLDTVRRTTDGIMFDPADDLPTLEWERDWIDGIRNHPGKLQIEAEADGRIVGLAGVYQAGRYRSRHTATIGISTAQGWRGRGLGALLMQTLIDFGRENDQIELLTLCLFEDNAPARALYRKLGFAEDGILPRRSKRHGVYLGNVEMSLWVGGQDAQGTQAGA